MGFLFVLAGFVLLGSSILERVIGVARGEAVVDVSQIVVVVVPIALGVIGLGVVLRLLAHRIPPVAALIGPLLGVALVVALNLLTNDATAGAQVALLLPVVYAAAYLERRGTVLVTACSVAGLIAVAVIILPASAAFQDAVFGSVIAVLAGMSVAHARRQRERGLAELRRRADIDALTGAWLRHVLDAAIRRLVDEPASVEGAALIIIDVDHFKSINDREGHTAGDAALRHVVSVLRGNVRPADLISRVGGDEFAVLFPECSRDSAMERAEAVLGELRANPVHLGGRLVPLSASVGVAHCPDNARSVDELYRAADEGLYHAKRAGRDRLGVPA